VCSGFIYGWSSNRHNSSLPTQQISPTLTPEPTAEPYLKNIEGVPVYVRNGRGFLIAFSLLAAHRTRLHTVNALERLNQEIRRRARVAGVFPNEASCLRLATALAIETSDKWEDSKVYLVLTD
jgi:hypothetical protein